MCSTIWPKDAVSCGLFRHYQPKTCTDTSTDALRDPPPADSKMLRWPNRQQDYSEMREDLYCLHLDMKPGNVLLGYPHEGDEYPSALLNDFGMSLYTSYTGEGPSKNPGQMWWRGTEPYKLPVSSEKAVYNCSTAQFTGIALTTRCRNKHITV